MVIARCKLQRENAEIRGREELGARYAKAYRLEAFPRGDISTPMLTPAYAAGVAAFTQALQDKAEL